MRLTDAHGQSRICYGNTGSWPEACGKLRQSGHKLSLERVLDRPRAETSLQRFHMTPRHKDICLPGGFMSFGRGRILLMAALGVAASTNAGRRALRRLNSIRLACGIGPQLYSGRALARGMTMRMYQVDAFTDRPFAGNPAAVLVLEDWLDEALMLAIAQENNLAETAFARPRADGDWDLRWFTPAIEVDFCGHATLATAHVLLAERGEPSPVGFQTRVGRLQVAAAGDGYRLDLPCLPPEPLDRLPPEAMTSFAKPPLHLFRNFENIFADLGDAEAVRDFRPDFSALGKLGRLGLVVTGQGMAGERADFVSRYFAPGAGIPEDPVTGSIHATLVPYWAGRLGRNKLLAYQASARGGWLGCELAGARVVLIGQAVTFMDAQIFLPGASS